MTSEITNSPRSTGRLGAFFTTLVLLSNFSAAAQSGGIFEITEAVIAGGGGQSSNGTTSVDSTAGQALATGSLGAYPFSLTSGFWNYTPLAPTAAPVTVAGRVVDSTGEGVAYAVLYMHLQEGQLRVARSSPFGFFQFEGVETGQTVLISVQSRFHTYMPRTVLVADEIVDLNFVPEQQPK